MEIKDIFDKLSSYNIFNYLFPGVVFCVIAEKISNFKLIQEELLNAFFVYYLVGMIISRVGSIIIEPVLKKISFVTFSEYSDYVKRSKEDPLLSTLSEQNNTYRTLLSMFLLLLVVDNFEKIQSCFLWLNNHVSSFLLTSMVILLAFAYRKQTSYIKKRVNK